MKSYPQHRCNMSRRDPYIRLRDMRDHAAEAIEILGQRTAVDVESERVIQLALVRLFEVIGEAASQVPREFRDRHPNIPWRDASSMRNLLIHDYDKIQYDILVKTIREQFPVFIQQIEALLPDSGSSTP